MADELLLLLKMINLGIIHVHRLVEITLKLFFRLHQIVLNGGTATGWHLWFINTFRGIGVNRSHVIQQTLEMLQAITALDQQLMGVSIVFGMLGRSLE